MHETTQNLDARTNQYERVRNEIEQITAQKIERENELNSELSRMKEVTDAERLLLIETNENLEKSFRLEKAELLANIDARLQQSDAAKALLDESLAKLEQQVKQLSDAVERGKTELRAKENDFNARVVEWTSLEQSLRQELDSCRQLEESTKNNMAETLRISESINQDLMQQLSSHKDNKIELLATIEELTTKLDDAVVERQSLADTLKTTETDKESLNSSASEMRSKFSEISAKFRSLEDEQVDLVDRNEQLIAQLKDATAKIEQLSNDCSTKDKQLSDTNIEFTDYQVNCKNQQLAIEQQLHDTKQKCVDNESTINTLTSQLNDVIAKLDCKQIEFSKLEESLANSITINEKKKSEAEDRRKTIEMTVQELDNKLKDRDQTIVNLEQKIIEASKSTDDLSTELQTKLIHYDGELKSKESCISQLNETILQLQKQINNQDLRLTEISNEKTVACQKSMDELTHKTEEIKEYQLKLNDLESKLHEKTEELSAIKFEHNKAKSELLEEINRQQNVHSQEIAKLSDRSEYDELQCAFTEFEATKKEEIIELQKKLSHVDAQIVEQADALKRMEKFKTQEQQLQQEKIDIKAREAKLLTENKILTDRVLQLQVMYLQVILKICLITFGFFFFFFSEFKTTNKFKC